MGRKRRYGKGDINLKEEFINLLKSINRDGINKLIEWLEKTDFYTAPASTKYHGAYEGGLVEHSLNVYRLLDEKLKQEPYCNKLNVTEDTIKIISLLHDVCKTNFYKVDHRNAKNEQGVWEKVPYYKIEDNLPYGHGEKSVMIISLFIKLSLEETMAIRWHMGFTEPKELYNTISTAYEKYPLCLALHEADLEATYLVEGNKIE